MSTGPAHPEERSAGAEARRRPSGDSSASKVLALLDTIADIAAPVGVSELALHMGLPKSTTHRLLKTLECHGLLDRLGPKYQLGERVLELSDKARASRYGRLSDAAVDVTAWLFGRVGTTVQIGVLQGSNVLLLHRVTGPDGLRLGGGVGCRFPAAASALGKSLLAFSPSTVKLSALRSLVRCTPYSIVDPRVLNEQLVEIRHRGYSFENEEIKLGVRCVGAPIWQGSQTVAAISICTTKALDPPAHGMLVHEAASRISRQLAP